MDIHFSFSNDETTKFHKVKFMKRLFFTKKLVVYFLFMVSAAIGCNKHPSDDEKLCSLVNAKIIHKTIPMVNEFLSELFNDYYYGEGHK